MHICNLYLFNTNKHVEQCQLAEYEVMLEQVQAKAKEMRDERAEKESLFKTLLNCSQALSSTTSNLDNVCMSETPLVSIICIRYGNS